MTDFGNSGSVQDQAPMQAEAARLSPEVYSQLKLMAHAHLRSFRPGMTLNSTALVHEVFLKLNDKTPQFKQSDDDNHFIAVASLAMRHILVDYVRLKNAEKRGSGALHLTFQESLVAADQPDVDLLELGQTT